MAITTYPTTYYDDFNTAYPNSTQTANEKNYLRILFKPGYSVQVRELNQMQSMLQSQIDKFGRSQWNDNVAVNGGETKFVSDIQYVDFNVADTVSFNFESASYLSYTPSGGATPIIADILHYETTTSSTYRFYIRYRSSSIVNGVNISSFPVNGVVAVNSLSLNQNVNITIGSFGYAIAIYMASGVFFTKGSFVASPEQSLFIPLTNRDSVLDGNAILTVVENQINYVDDETLLDNANGTPNYSAPGADRYSIDLVLGFDDASVTVDDSINPPTKIVLAAIINNVPTATVEDRTAFLNPQLAQRTFEESGNYVIDPFKINVRELYDDGSNFGRFTQSNLDKAKYNISTPANRAASVADAKTRYSLEVDPSTAYVEGYRVVLNNKYDINAEKARESSSLLLTNTYAAIGNYVVGTFQTGSLLPDTRDLTRRFNLNVSPVTRTATLTTGSTEIYILSTDGLVIGMPVSATTGIASGTVISAINVSTNRVTLSEAATASNPQELVFNKFADVPATCKIKTVEPRGGNTYRVYLYDIQMRTGASANIAQLNLLTSAETTPLFNFNITVPLAEASSDTAVFQLPYNAIQTVSGVKYIIKHIESGSVTISGTNTTLPISIPSGGSLLDQGSTVNVILNVGGKFVESQNITAITTTGITISNSGLTPGSNTWSAIIPVQLNGPNNNGVSAFTKTLTPEVKTFSTTVNAIDIVIGRSYEILTVGTTNYVTSFGASANNVGSVFVATASGISTSGSGTVKQTQSITEFTLPHADVYKLTNVLFKKDSASAEISVLSDCVISDDGQRSNYYTNVKVKYNGPQQFLNTNTIRFEYLRLARDVPSTNNINGFATANSYINQTNQTNGLTYDNIPSFNNIRLSDCIDFRPIILSGASATTNKQQIDPGSAILSNSIIYLPRIDKLVVVTDAEFKIVKGISSLQPIDPVTPANSMALYTLEIPAYTYKASDIKINYIDNRRYTMRDIGSLESRITNLEEYTELSKLENAAQNKVIGDILGSRFKNAVVTDGFLNHDTGDVLNDAYNCSIDPDEGIARPAFSTRSVSFKSLTNTINGQAINSGDVNIARGENIVTLSYTEQTLINQPYASSHESVNPYEIITYQGNIELSPSSDEWKDVEIAKTQIVVNTGAFDDATKNTIVGTVWNNWTTTWTGKKVVTKKKARNPANGSTMRQITTSTPTVQKRTGTSTTLTYTDIVERKEDRIIDISFIPFMRSRKVYFRAKRLKPLTRVYPFFDGIDISAYTMMTPFVPFANNSAVRDYKGFSPTTGTGLDFETTASLTTSDYGEIEGMFLVPNNDSLKFKVGTRAFKLTDSPNNTQADETTFVQSEYTATGISETVQTSIVTTRVPQVKTIALSESRTFVDTRVTWDDPLAQSFMLSSVSTGAFITSIDLYFKQISTTAPVSIHIVTLENGYPTQKIVPFSVVTKNPYATAGNVSSDQLIIPSDDSTEATNFKFSDPIYLKANVEYAIVIMSSDPKYRVWVADSNGFDVTTTPNKPINKNVYAGSFFKSQNGSTWSAEQTRDLKFKINRAVFVNDGKIEFKPVLDNGVSGITVNAQGATVNTGFTSGATVRLPMPYAASAGANANIAETPGVYEAAEATLTVDPLTTAVIAVTITDRGLGYGTADTAAWFNTNTVWTSNGTTVNTTLANNFTVSLDSAAITSFSLVQSNLSIPDTTINNTLIFGVKDAINTISTQVDPYENYDFPDLYTIDLDTASSTTLETTLSTTNNFVSPVIDLDRVSLLAIKNEVNDDTLGENTLDAGAATSRYLTKLIKLDKAANQLNVYLDVNCPSTDANIAVYFKLIYDENADIPTEWELIDPTSPLPTTTDYNAFTEVEYEKKSPANDFLAFAVKIVFLSGNTYDVVSIANLKVIATTGL